MTIEPGCVVKISRVRLIASASLLVIAALTLGGCQTTSSADSIITGSTQPASLKTTAEAAKRWESDPGNVKHGLHYAKLLKGIGQTDKALKVMAELVSRDPGNANLLAIYGKELAEAGRAEQGGGNPAPSCDERQGRLENPFGARLGLRSARAIQGSPRGLPSSSQAEARGDCRPQQSRHVVRARGQSGGSGKNAEAGAAEPRGVREPTLSRTWPWWWGCRVVSMKQKTSPARTCRQCRSKPT